MHREADLVAQVLGPALRKQHKRNEGEAAVLGILSGASNSSMTPNSEGAQTKKVAPPVILMAGGLRMYRGILRNG
jgi:hypothetical protein